MTLDGTNTWVLPGSDGAVVIDPGQAEPAAHLEDVLAAVPSVALVLVTHGHHDHVELAAALAERTGAPVRAADPAHCVGAPALRDGETIAAGDVSLRVLATPGHTSDSVCFVHPDGVFTGDTILGRGTTVVAHPDGALGPYLASLRALQALGDLTVHPGHGPTLPSVADVAAQYLEHREQRLEQVRAALRELGPDASARQVVELVYADVDPAVWWAAELSVAAQLDYLLE
ncbi:MBL fold metallo-hydrolase [Jatrophihabitans endophyticus]|uniref:MBL fold metallo-hydrolase n=1 Tax=Jatrophihabitans endophyticus TaxID=1206085 RepID=UPI0019ED00DA|nr:MBL fold metallo-hydrolase [Jatrophihabitans endophyticus]